MRREIGVSGFFITNLVICDVKRKKSSKDVMKRTDNMVWIYGIISIVVDIYQVISKYRKWIITVTL